MPRVSVCGFTLLIAHRAVVPAQRRRLHARQPVLVRDGDVRAVVDQALEEVLLGAAHQRRHREEERDAEHHAGKRHERLALAGGQMRERDVEREHHFVRRARAADASRDRAPSRKSGAGESTMRASGASPSTISVRPAPVTPMRTGCRCSRPSLTIQTASLWTAVAGTSSAFVALGDDQVRIDGHADFQLDSGSASLMRTR